MQANAPQFVLDDEPIIDWPVTVRLPVSGGKFEERRFTARIRVLSEEEIDALVPDEEGDDTDIEAKTKAALARKRSAVLEENARLLPAIVVGWGADVVGADGKPAPFSAELLAAQLKGKRGMALSAGLWRAVNEIRYGLEPYGVSALEGNGAPAPAAGSSKPEAQATTS